MAFDPHEQLSIIPVVARQSAHMIQAFRQWPRDHWSRATYCDGWTIANMVAHLATGADYHTEVLTSGLSGNPTWPWGAANLDEVRAIRAKAVQTLCDSGPEALLSGFEASANRLQTVLESLQIDDLDKVALYPRMPIPLGQWVGMRLIELVVHDWDMRQPYELPALLTPFAIPAVLRILAETQVRFLSYRLPEGMRGSYAMLAGDTGWTVHVEDQQAAYEASASVDCTACLQVDPERLILLTLGRVGLDGLLASDDCCLIGDAEAGRIFFDVLFSPYQSSSVSTPEVQ